MRSNASPWGSVGQCAKDENQHLVPPVVAVAVTFGSRSGFCHSSKAVSGLAFGWHVFLKKHFLGLCLTLKRKSLLQAVEEAAGSEKLYVVVSNDINLQDYESCPELQQVGLA